MNGGIGLDVFRIQNIDPTLILGILLGIAAVAGVCTYGSYLHQRYRRFKEFNEEMHSLGLDHEQEGTLASLVKRYRMDKPVEVLLSEKLFDEMATQEMVRILATQASMDVKEKYIRELYAIRERTYGKTWDPRYVNALPM